MDSRLKRYFFTDRHSIAPAWEPSNPANARFVLTYRDQEFAVANINSLSSGPGNALRKDHSIEVLSVLHQLVNLDKSASDIRATPSVQVLP